MAGFARFSRFAQHLLTFFLHFAHGGFVMAGVLVIGLMGYQVTRFGSEGLNPRAMFGYRAVAGVVPEASSLAMVAYEEPSSDDLSGQPLGMERVSSAIAKRHRVSPVVVESLVKAAQREGRNNGVDPLLILAVITVESGFNPFSESVLGAQGLMQIIPKFHTDKIDLDKGGAALFDPAENIRVGTIILRSFMRTSGSLEAALQMYGGAGADPELKYSGRVLQELDRLRQIAGLPVTTRTASRAKIEAGEG